MNQTRLGSLIEAIVNVLIGFGINFAANLIVLPMFGFNVKPIEAFGIGLIFTAISIARSYVIRRWFNARLHAAAMALAGRSHQKDLRNDFEYAFRDAIKNGRTFRNMCDEIITDCRLSEAARTTHRCHSSGCNYPQGECIGSCMN